MVLYTRDDLYLIEICHRLAGMRKQEVSHYTIPDYLVDEWQKKLREATEAMQHCNVSIVHGAGNDVVTPPSAPSAVVVAGVGDAFQARAAHAAVVAATANHGGDAPANDGDDWGWVLRLKDRTRDIQEHT